MVFFQIVYLLYSSIILVAYASPLLQTLEHCEKSLQTFHQELSPSVLVPLLRVSASQISTTTTSLAASIRQTGLVAGSVQTSNESKSLGNRNSAVPNGHHRGPQSTAAIVGGICGSILILLLGGMASWLMPLWKQRKARIEAEKAEEAEKGRVEAQA